MAVVKMRKLQLVAMSYDKDALLDAIQKTGAVEIVLENKTNEESVALETLSGYFATVETALDSLCVAVERKQKDDKEKSDLLKDGFDVSYNEFFAIENKKEEMDGVVEQIKTLLDEKNVLQAELLKTIREQQQASPYSLLKLPFSYFQNTAHTQVRLGVVATAVKSNVQEALQSQDLCSYKLLNETEEEALFLVVCHKAASINVNAILAGFSFSDASFDLEKSGEEIYRGLVEKERALKTQISKNEATMYALKDEIKPLKVYCDYLRFTLEKADTSEKFSHTERTFSLQAYLPEDAETEVKEAIRSVSSIAYMDFSDPTDEDTPPTLLKNNAIVSNFESITDTYSTPNYREFDPNAVMAFFYSLFMGFIIGDAGYGLLMAVVGGWLWYKGLQKPSGMSKLAGAFACGGIFAILWGALFNSFFGFMVLPKTFMPNPQTDMWLLAGISVPSVLIISMVLGIFQLFVGYICKAVQEWRRGDIGSGICDGVVWAIFSVGMALLIVGFVEEANVPILGTIGAITAGVSLLLAMILAGRKEKFFGKFTKGFGTLYGIINYASDILSYARLYGLMLSGAVVAGIIATYSGQFIVSGNVALIVLGVVLLLVGHGFNLVMNLLGAYIHDARLQYVEFYGRFYEGEGESFKPFGSKNKYVALTKQQTK